MEIDYLSLKRITAMHGEEIHRAIGDVVDSGWYLQGKAVAEFEAAYAAYTGMRHCISTGNGLDALTIMIRGYMEMGLLREGDEVLVPANTYIATILSISENRLRPVLVEPRPDNFQIDDSLIEKAITQKTRALMIVHLYGYDAYTERIAGICRQNGLILLQDCAQSHGLALHSPWPKGEGHMACAHSFYPGKNLGALADAGAITTDEDDLAEAVRAIANYGSQRKYVFRYRGRNSRMDEISAAVLKVKLKYLDADNRRRQEIAGYYIDNIKGAGITLPPRDGVHHIFPILSPQRDELQERLLRKGVHTMIHYPIPPHRQECYREWAGMSLPVTEMIHSQELSLPINQAMTDEEAAYVVEAVNAAAL